MAISTKPEAQRRVDQIAAFRRELQRLEAEGVLTLGEAQRQAIHSHHERLLSGLSREFDVDRSTGARQLSLGMRIASFLGALALAASVFFLFHRFWGLLDTPAQLAVLIAAPLILFAATLQVARHDTSGYFVKLLAMVAFACFVLNLVMLGDIFNITPSDNALLVWAGFAFLLAYALEVRLLLAAGILCLIAFLSARAGTTSGMYWLYFGMRPENFLPAGVLLFGFPLLVDQHRFPGFAALYRVIGLLTLFLPLLVLGNWGQGSYLALDDDFIEGFYQVAGFLLSGAAIWLGVHRHWNEVVNTGNTFFVIFLYTKFYDWWWESMPKYLFFLVIGLSAVLFLLIFRRLRHATNPDGEEGGT